ncbi:hypothetical protein [Chryseobacterium taihuense]|uniref:Molecular chaperone GroES n=1 Tax=Chryseobacterium taihuense TaxID=1141221 RepID=A0ABY0QQV9_9FLAO|nr:hypothetical protein [Chryseobacterium taihuense]SDL56345.1 hypothetical protein SAMN05216273_102201 [Chryseobacterium taihuense]
MNSKNIAVCVFFLLGLLLHAQNVYLSKVEKTNDNNDKYLFQIGKDITNSEYLGEIDVIGFSDNDLAVFANIYKKAKDIGANSFAYQPVETIDGKIQPFNPANYKIKLYYSSKEELSKPSDLVYIFSSSQKPQKISINKKEYVLQPRSFMSIKTIPGDTYVISTKKLLGSTIRVSGQSGSTAQYFQISSLKVRSNTYGEPGINLKSGDITVLDRSYGDFLRMIYTKNEK